MITIQNNEDLLKLLDQLLKEDTSFNWDSFYGNRERDVPFFADHPDENVVANFENGLFQKGKKVLELGCGPGRNAVYFAEQGCQVDAIDLSEAALKWAEERALAKNVKVDFRKANIFEMEMEEGSYDIVYDSGCFHHIPPHRRMSYINLLKRALKPNGLFGLTCFSVGGKYGGADLSDLEVYKKRSLKSGLGFTEDRLKTIFNEFQALEVREMKHAARPGVFAIEGLMVALFRK